MTNARMVEKRITRWPFGKFDDQINQVVIVIRGYKKQSHEATGT
jgi:hypothetical protein